MSDSVEFGVNSSTESIFQKAEKVKSQMMEALGPKRIGLKPSPESNPATANHTQKIYLSDHTTPDPNGNATKMIYINHKILNNS